VSSLRIAAAIAPACGPTTECRPGANTLNFNYEVRSADEASSELPAAEADEEMLDLALHIIKKKAGRFDPTKFDD
jgi:non-homologous end joining protein Ku